MTTFIALCISLSILLGGCLNMGNILDEEKAGEARKEAYEKENYVRIQDYTGEGYTLRNTRKETGQIAEANREELEEAVEAFFLEDYKTKVIVHNIVSAVEGVSVFVESVGEPHFYTFAIVPIDVKNKKVKTDRVWSQEGQVENAIKASLYAMVFDQEFSNLNTYLEDAVQKQPITGTPLKAIENVGANGYATSYYYTSILGVEFDEIYTMYLKNPEISKKELKNSLVKEDFESDRVIITVYLYMKEANTNPDKDVFNEIVDGMEKLEHIPKGAYSIVLNDNYIDKRRARGTKENTLDRSVPNEIIKR